MKKRLLIDQIKENNSALLSKERSVNADETKKEIKTKIYQRFVEKFGNDRSLESSNLKIKQMKEKKKLGNWNSYLIFEVSHNMYSCESFLTLPNLCFKSRYSKLKNSF